MSFDPNKRCIEVWGEVVNHGRLVPAEATARYTEEIFAALMLMARGQHSGFTTVIEVTTVSDVVTILVHEDTHHAGVDGKLYFQGNLNDMSPLLAFAYYMIIRYKSHSIDLMNTVGRMVSRETKDAIVRCLGNPTPGKYMTMVACGIIEQADIAHGAQIPWSDLTSEIKRWLIQGGGTVFSAFAARS